MIPRDAGLQAQRCALAWTRTALSVLVNALLVLRAGLRADNGPLSALGVLLLLAAAIVLAFGMQRRRLLGAVTPGAPAATMMLAVVGVTWLACAGSVVAVSWDDF